jgi:hypothetical protein
MSNEKRYERFVRAVEAQGGKVTEPKWLGRFVEHHVICGEGHPEHVVIPGNVLKGQGICRKCGTERASRLRTGSRRAGQSAPRQQGGKLQRKYTCIGFQDNGCTEQVAYRDKRCRRCTTKYQNARRRDVIIESNAQRRVAKKDEIAAYQLERRESGKQAAQAEAYYQAHAEVIKVRTLQYARDHPEQARASQLRHHKRGIEGMNALDMEIEVEYRKAIRNDPCFYCGGPGEHDDHYQALDGKPKGNNMWFNLVRACSSCNCSKRTKHGDDFLAKVNPQKATRLAPLAYLWAYPGGWDRWLADRKAHGNSQDEPES